MNTDGFDLESYFRRIGYAGARAPTYAVLEALHLAHATHIPFENLDVLLKRPIRLDLASLQDKLVRGGRGGYCFEQNLLFAGALRAAGFSLTPLAARVRYRAPAPMPRTHMLLLVETGDGAWLADVGFGGEGLLLPVAFEAGRETVQFAWRYRVVSDTPGLWLLQSERDGAWLDLYSFSLEAQTLPDYEMANHYLCTHPASRFRQTLTVQLPTPAARHILRNLELIEDRGTKISSRTLSGPEERLEVLADIFGLRLPAGTQFHLADATADA